MTVGGESGDEYAGGVGTERRALPSALRYKDELLDGRMACISDLGSVLRVLRNWGFEANAARELEVLQGDLAQLYMLLKPKFPAAHPIHEFEKRFLANARIPMRELSGYLSVFLQKLEDMGITKIEKTFLSGKKSYQGVE